MPSLKDILKSQTRLHGVRSNFVIDQNGNYVDSTGSSRGLSNEYDLEMLKKLRSLSDLIITDSATSAKEGYKPSRFAPIEVWSSSGNFSGRPSLEGLENKTVPNPGEELRQRKKRFKSILLESGPTLTGILGQHGLIDDLRISVIGAENEASAAQISTKFRNRLNLEYLRNCSVQVHERTYFFTFIR